jgi:hypothetical protein
MRMRFLLARLAPVTAAVCRYRRLRQSCVLIEDVRPNSQQTHCVVACDGAGNVSIPCDPVTVATPEAPFGVFLPLMPNNSRVGS